MHNKINITAITGTNGKTSVAYFLYQILNMLGKKAAYIGTLGCLSENYSKELINTTPGKAVNIELLRKFEENNVTDLFIEASSHGLEQNRIADLNINCGVVTNIYSDHLDYHKTIDNYVAAKEKLLDFNLSHAVLNADDSYFERFLNKAKNNNFELISYGIDNNADLIAENIKLDINGTYFTIKNKDKKVEVTTKILGYFNVYNLLAVAGVLLTQYKLSLDQIAHCFSQLKMVPGRMEVLKHEDGPSIIIDYAHNEDSLKNLLKSIREMFSGKIFLVFGAGGDRDKSKRAPMAMIAENYADYSFITEDNSRFESSNTIIKDIIRGFTKGSFSVLLDRKDAILAACANAKPQDVVVIAGKGHEQYLEINGNKIPFSEKNIIKDFYENTISC